nr:DNA-directed RNA polymerase subunit 5 [Abalone asfa-like virus]
MNQIPQYLVYKHLFDFMKYRNLKYDGEYLLASHDSNKSGILEKERFLTLIQQFGYFRVDTISNKTDKYVILVIIADQNSKYISRVSPFQTFLQTLLTNKKDKTREIEEIILIVPSIIFSRKNICDVVKLMPEKAPDIYFNMFPYNIFTQIIPEAKIVSKHEIVPSEDIKKILDNDYTVIDALPLISCGDAPVVWAGGRPGDLIKVTRLSETTGAATVVRLVVKDLRY